MKDKVNEALKIHFRPEFLNRIDEVIVFHELAREEVMQMVDLMTKRLTGQLEGQGLGIELTQSAKELLAERGYDPQLGARPLRRAIQRMIEDVLSEKILYKEFRAGEIIVVDAEDDPEKPARSGSSSRRSRASSPGRGRAGGHRCPRGAGAHQPRHRSRRSADDSHAGDLAGSAVRMRSARIVIVADTSVMRPVPTMTMLPSSSTVKASTSMSHVNESRTSSVSGSRRKIAAEGNNHFIVRRADRDAPRLAATERRGAACGIAVPPFGDVVDHVAGDAPDARRRVQP